jgi:hypothetical protein
MYEENKNKVPMNKPYNIQNTNICNDIFHISFFVILFVRITWSYYYQEKTNPGRFAPNPVRSVSLFAPIPVRPWSFHPHFINSALTIIF